MDRFNVVQWSDMSELHKTQAIEMTKKAFGRGANFDESGYRGALDRGETQVGDVICRNNALALIDGDRCVAFVQAETLQKVLVINNAVSTFPESINDFLRLTGRTPMEELCTRIIRWGLDQGCTTARPLNMTTEGKKFLSRIEAKWGIGDSRDNKDALPQPTDLKRLQATDIRTAGIDELEKGTRQQGRRDRQ